MIALGLTLASCKDKAPDASENTNLSESEVDTTDYNAESLKKEIYYKDIESDYYGDEGSFFVLSNDGKQYSWINVPLTSEFYVGITEEGRRYLCTVITNEYNQEEVRLLDIDFKFNNIYKYDKVRLHHKDGTYAVMDKCEIAPGASNLLHSEYIYLINDDPSKLNKSLPAQSSLSFTIEK